MSCASPGTSSPHQSPAAKLPAWLCSDLFPLYLVSAEAANKPESPEGPTSTGCWFAPDGCAATDTEIYLLAALFVVGTEDEKKEREWADQVLAEEARAMRLQAAGDVWRPVHNWQGNTNGFALKSMLTKSSRTVEVVIELVKSTTGRRLLDADVTMYLEKLRMEKLTGPTWTKKRKGSARHIAALISVARVVFDKGGALRRVLVAQREQPCAASPTKEEAVAAHMMEMAALALVHGIEVETLRETIEELDGLVVCARDRAQAYRRQRCKAVERKQAATSTSNERWKAKLADMKGAWKAAAIEDVEAAHGSAMVRLKELKAQAHAAKRAALAAASKAEKLSGVRLASAKAADELASELQTRVHDLEDALHESAADAIEKLNQIRELKVVGSGHGHSRWWPWWVRAMIMEQLVNGTPPTAIPRNIACDAAYLVPFLEVKVPNVQLCRRMRGELRIVTETLAAFRIGKAVNWRQLFTDGTSRRQTALLTAIIAIDGPDGELVPIVVRGAFVATGETSEQQVDDILERALARGAAKLTRLREVFEELFPGVPHDIPAANEIDISKLGNGGAVCSDNCNPAMKVKRLLKAEIQAAVEAKYDAAAWAALSEEEKAAKRLVLEIDCWNHLRNTWLGAVTSALTGRLKENLKEEIDAIDFRLRVGTDMVMVLRAADKEFSLCANYPKGHGDLFREWMQRVHPKALLLHVIRTAGSRQDLAFDGSRAPRTVEVVIELVKSTTGRRLLDADVTMYLEKLRMEKLTGPTWTKKRKGSARHIAALISVARVVFDKGGALRRVLVAQREQPCAASPTKEEAVAAHMMEMAALALVHGIEVETLRETIEELDGLVVCARDRAQAYRRQRCKAVERKQAATSTSNERWKAKLADMKGAWKAAAIEDVEAAHGSAMVRLKELKAQAHAAKRAALAAASKAEKLSGVRLASAKAADELASELQTRVHDLEDALHESAADAIEKLNQIRELKVVGSGHGHSRWWPWWVRAMIMEQLVNGTPPTAIPRNIACDAAYLVPFLEVKVPNVQLCRRMRGELRIVTETLAAFRIGKAVNWRQLFTDGTSRRQTALLTAIIAIDGPDGELVPIVVRGAFVATGETSEQQVDDILERALARGAAKLTRLREVFEELFPGVPHDIPAANEIDISKLGNGGAVCSDNCNPAMKVKRLLKAEIQAAVEAKYDAAAWAALSEEEKAAKRLVLEIDCWNHLRNTWLGAVTSALTGRLKENLKEEIDAIDFRLRVGTDMVMVLRAADKEFSLCANYPKGHGDLFREWMQRVHPKALLLHVIRTAGSRQDLAFDGSRALYLNRRYWVEFLDERLRVPSASNILQECLYVLLTSVEMVASARIHSIINLAIVLPMRWLAGKTHTLAAFDWSERSMGRAVKLLEIALVKIGENAKLVLDESFMMHIFDELSNELPPFQEYLAYMYDEKKMAMAGSSITEHQYRRLRDELFNPMDADNVDSTDAALELGALAASTMLIELRDPKKATSRHLDGELSWGNTSLEEHAAALRKMGVNDPAESIFGAVTRELMVYGRIGFGAASGIATARRNRDFARGISKEKRKSSKKGSAAKLESTGLFHSISIEMREALITMAARDNRSELAIDRADLESQRAARRCKEELASEKGRESASESYIDALYYFEMWGSAACWKTTTKADEEYAKLTSKSAQLEALKEQIRIRVEGLGWSELSCAWSKNGVQFLPDELMKHLKMLIAE